MSQGYFSYTADAQSGEWTCWFSERQPPREATGRTMLFLKGEVHFGIGQTKEDAFADLFRTSPELVAS